MEDVYSIVLLLNDFICGAADTQIKYKQHRKQTTSGQEGPYRDHTPPLLTLLEKEKPRYHLPPSSQETTSSSSSSAAGASVQTEPSAEAVASSFSSGSAHTATGLIKHQSQGDSELEEDDEEEVTGARKPPQLHIIVPYGRSKKKSNARKQYAKG